LVECSGRRRWCGGRPPPLSRSALVGYGVHGLLSPARWRSCPCTVTLDTSLMKLVAFRWDARRGVDRRLVVPQEA
jgi:hypothetical protein